MMFEHWIKPPIFEDAEQFFETCPVPIYIVSNIDRDAVWVNRSGRDVPDGVISVGNLLEVYDTRFFR